MLLSGSTVLLFTSLGHYYLWTDEADTALLAIGVWNTGDTSAQIDERNIFAYQLGAHLRILKNRYTSPLQYYLAAPMYGLFGRDAYWARFPFALCGLLCVAMIALWLWRDRAEERMCWLVTLGVLGNVSFFLFCRQCRYYAPAILLTVVVAYLYCHWNGGRWTLVAISLAAACLFASHYLAFAALAACALVDYFIWGPPTRLRGLHNWLLLLVPLVLIGGTVLWIWNPIGKEVFAAGEDRNWFLDRVILSWWMLRDINACEFGVGTLMLIAPLTGVITRDRRLWRASTALAVYVLGVVIMSPQPMHLSEFAAVRYVAPLIPLCVFIGACVMAAMTRRLSWFFWLPLAVIAFGTNVLHHPTTPQRWRATPIWWVGELRQQRTTPTMVIARWIRANVQPGESVWVQPGYATYPLMYHAPQALYAWQLRYRGDPQFEHLPRIQFYGRAPVDVMIAMGDGKKAVETAIARSRRLGVDYHRVATIERYWDDLIRPELLWRSFVQNKNFDSVTESVFIYRRTDSDRTRHGSDAR